MPKRSLCVIKWLSQTPTIAVCMACNTQFKVPLVELHKTKDAQAYLQEQFERHKCKSEDTAKRLRESSEASPSYNFDNNNQIVGSNVLYDAAGNVTQNEAGHAFTYDAERRMLMGESDPSSGRYDKADTSIQPRTDGTNLLGV